MSEQLKTPVLDILRDEERWIQGLMAANQYGIQCRSDEREACRFCLLGAIRRAYGTGTSPEKTAAKGRIRAAIDKLFPGLREPEGRHGGLIGFNDSDNTTHEMIVKVLEEAKV